MLHLARSDCERIRAWARAAWPREACGLMLGARRGERIDVAAVRLARNLELEHAGERFEMDPRDVVAADREARAAGLEIVAAWHSHVDRPALPSVRDRAAVWPGWSCAIVRAGAGGAGPVRAWRVQDGELAEQAIVVGPD